MRSVDRFVVFNVGATKATKRGYGNTEACSRRTFTSYGDAAKAAWRCSKQTKQAGVASVASKPCLLLHGMPGSEKLVGRCLKGKCTEPESGDRALMNRCKLTKAAQKKARADLIRERASGRNRNVGAGMGPSAMRHGKKYNPETGELGRARKGSKKKRR